jgi:hypothetical protein
LSKSPGPDVGHDQKGIRRGQFATQGPRDFELRNRAPVLAQRERAHAKLHAQVGIGRRHARGLLQILGRPRILPRLHVHFAGQSQHLSVRLVRLQGGLQRIQCAFILPLLEQDLDEQFPGEKAIRILIQKLLDMPFGLRQGIQRIMRQPGKKHAGHMIRNRGENFLQYCQRRFEFSLTKEEKRGGVLDERQPRGDPPCRIDIGLRVIELAGVGKQ